MAKAKTTKKVEKKEIEVTEELLKMHPEWEANGISVGDFIEDDEIVEVEEVKSAPVKASKGAMAVLKNGTHYIRTYSADQTEELASFLSKNAAYSAVEDSTIKELIVSYKVTDVKTGVVKQEAKVFTDKKEAITFANSRKAIAVVK